MLNVLSNSSPALAIIEARMGSSRLPGKVMKEILGKPVLGLMIDRIRLSKEVSEICIATSTNSADDEIEKLARELGILVFRGSEDNLLNRVASAAQEFDFEVIVALTGDCPLLDPILLDQMVQSFRLNECDFLTNCHYRSYPDGMDIQVLNKQSLLTASRTSIDLLEFEHTTLHLRRHPELFKTVHIAANRLENHPSLGLTLDEIDDFRLIQAIFDHFSPRLDFSLREILEFLRLNPKLLEINSQVTRKGDS
jgi:spore coat polysaccharide biosynthesis protein SpsF